VKNERVEDFYPLSPMQEGILFHTLRAPASGLYVPQLGALVRGDFEVEAFTRAWREVLELHAVLRTSFVWEGLKRPVQVVQRGVKLPVRQDDWRSLSAAGREKELGRFLEADRERGFSLGEAPLTRLSLLQVADDAYYFVWSHHHLLLDGWSARLVLQDVLTFYDAFRRGRQVAPERPRPYRDYIVWLHRQDLCQAEGFWRRTLRGFSQPTPLGMAVAPDGQRPPPPEQAEEEFRLPETTTAGLQALAQRQHLTLNTIVQGMWALLLSRYSGAEDVVYGAVVSGRPDELAGAALMIGLFINTLPVRVHVAAEEPLLAWLKRFQGQLSELREYQHSPLVEIQGWSEVPRGQPLFESILSFDHFPVSLPLERLGGSCEIIQTHSTQRSSFPLAVVVVPGQELSVRISGDGRRFDAATVTRISRHLERLLRNVLTQAHEAVGSLRMLSEEEEILLRKPTYVEALDEGFSF